MPKLSLAKLERHLYAAADILRREGMDAATYKDYIFGLLFLKRSSDVFEAERERVVGRKVAQGMAREAAEVHYGENPDFYTSFFVPERARWAYLQSRLNDANEPYGAVLDKALGALSEENDQLEHVLDHVQFLRVQSNKRVVSDDACKELVRHFGRYRLRNEDFQFSDLLGSAYEFLINMFAESAGKKGGDFYTPRDVIRLMVRILQPTAGMSIYDPTCGSGGMLIISREYIEQSGGDPTNLRLCGQVNDPSAWSICKLNMLLHGVPGADIRLEDTLVHPLHREGGDLERFDRVIANPPFSQNYTRTNMEFPERFLWGWAPTTGKKADLMFAQHMLAVCKPNGIVVTVMPNGVLFRGGVEKKIRTKFLEQDLIEAVIALPPNLFYGAGIPACLLVMRPNLTHERANPNKPPERRRQVLFINSDAEFQAGRAQNYLRPEHIEKVISTYYRFVDVPNYARRVTIEEISDSVNDWSLNVRRYVDNAPPPEPHDVRAHQLGGVPVAEVNVQLPLYTELGFEAAQVFCPRPGDARYVDFGPAVNDRNAVRVIVEGDPGIKSCFEVLNDALASWWTAHTNRLVELPARRNLNAVRAEFLENFEEAFASFQVLDRFRLAGVVATWWTETLPDLKTLMEMGFPSVVDGWVDAIADAVEADDGVGPAFDPLNHKLVRRTMSDYLAEMLAAKADIGRLRGEKEAFEQSNPPDDADENELAKWNYAKDVEQRIKDAKALIREKAGAAKALKDRQKALSRILRANVKAAATLTGKGPRSIERARRTGVDVEALEAELISRRSQLSQLQADVQIAEEQLIALEMSCKPEYEEIAELERELEPYEVLNEHIAKARERFRELRDAFVRTLQVRFSAMNDDLKRELVLELWAADLRSELGYAMSQKRQKLTTAIEALWDKYRVPYNTLGQTSKTTESDLLLLIRQLGYT